MLSTGPGWTPAHDAALDEFKRQGVDEVQLASVLGEIGGDIGAFHTHRDAEFNLLFHASIEGSLPAVKVSQCSERHGWVWEIGIRFRVGSILTQSIELLQKVRHWIGRDSALHRV